MSDSLRQQIYTTLSQETTEKLSGIWQNNNRAEWTDLSFEVMAEILHERLGELPVQNDPVYETAKQLEEEQEDKENLEKENEESGPVFYEPQEVLSLNIWLNRAAIFGAAVAAIMSAITMPNMQSTISSIFPNAMSGSIIASLGAIVISLLAAALQGAIIYFPLRGLSTVLKILMEMEFNSRGVK
jgi:hypothetical protein